MREKQTVKDSAQEEKRIEDFGKWLESQINPDEIISSLSGDAGQMAK